MNRIEIFLHYGFLSIATIWSKETVLVIYASSDVRWWFACAVRVQRARSLRETREGTLFPLYVCTYKDCRTKKTSYDSLKILLCVRVPSGVRPIVSASPTNSLMPCPHKSAAIHTFTDTVCQKVWKPFNTYKRGLDSYRNETALQDVTSPSVFNQLWYLYWKYCNDSAQMTRNRND